MAPNLFRWRGNKGRGGGVRLKGMRLVEKQASWALTVLVVFFSAFAFFLLNATSYRLNKNTLRSAFSPRGSIGKEKKRNPPWHPFLSRFA